MGGAGRDAGKMHGGEERQGGWQNRRRAHLLLCSPQQLSATQLRCCALPAGSGPQP